MRTALPLSSTISFSPAGLGPGPEARSPTPRRPVLPASLRGCALHILSFVSGGNGASRQGGEKSKLRRWARGERKIGGDNDRSTVAIQSPSIDRPGADRRRSEVRAGPGHFHRRSGGWQSTGRPPRSLRQCSRSRRSATPARLLQTSPAASRSRPGCLPPGRLAGTALRYAAHGPAPRQAASPNACLSLWRRARCQQATTRQKARGARCPRSCRGHRSTGRLALSRRRQLLFDSMSHCALSKRCRRRAGWECTRATHDPRTEILVPCLQE
jgi:hypothetical protein